MNYNNFYLHKLDLLPRNEGKIKSYESCHDLRAWSHDITQRNRYLKEWMKCDMPICILPAGALVDILKKMTCGSKGKTTPRCHPQCKSKVVLDSICTSCHAMKDCFRNEENFDKYFEDEEFETSHWPCERCLEALKSVKMFWKIIVEKLFNINLTKSEQLERSESCYTDSVRSVARVWQSDMINQALFVKNISPLLCRATRHWKGRENAKVHKGPAPRNINPCGIENCCRNIDNHKSKTSSCSRSCKMTDTHGLSSSTLHTHTHHRKFKTPPSVSSYSRRLSSRHTLAKLKTVDISCDCTDLKDEMSGYRVKFDILQKKYKTQEQEIKKLQKENGSLRIELQNLYKNSWWKECMENNTCTIGTGHSDVGASIPKPFEDCVSDEKIDVNAKSVDSEMIITMKNCKNETYKHVSLLQVLHKTNMPVANDLNLNKNHCKKEDPLVLLAKVHNKFGAIVSREISLASQKKCYPKKIDINASFHTVNVSKSEPSCTTVGSSDSSYDVRLVQET
ncbi:uncharacterized protein LOC142987236 [Anticarsia gemmatalis]|uniref:uncharacterized protein LOC142987236 n=1 Tax=Anticarsia gemmatalis TaxID=129554 RepID=UPI003F758ECE